VMVLWTGDVYYGYLVHRGRGWNERIVCVLERVVCVRKGRVGV